MDGFMNGFFTGLAILVIAGGAIVGAIVYFALKIFGG